MGWINEQGIIEQEATNSSRLGKSSWRITLSTRNKCNKFRKFNCTNKQDNLLWLSQLI